MKGLIFKTAPSRETLARSEKLKKFYKKKFLNYIYNKHCYLQNNDCIKNKITQTIMNKITFVSTRK